MLQIRVRLQKFVAFATIGLLVLNIVHCEISSLMSALSLYKAFNNDFVCIIILLFHNPLVFTLWSFVRSDRDAEGVEELKVSYLLLAALRIMS